MADSSRVISLHFPRSMLCGFGAFAYLAGLNGTFASYTKVDMQLNITQPIWKRRNRWAEILLYASVGFLISGLVLILLSTLLYETEKQVKASTVAGLVQQVRAENEGKEKINEVGVMNGMASAAILVGLGLMLYNFHTDGHFHISSLLLYAAGWMTAAVSLSSDSKALSSTNWKRLAWTLPGALLTIMGTSAIPQEREYLMTGPSMALTATGLFAMVIGHGYVAPA